MHENANALDAFDADATPPVTGDFTYEDRRSGGMNFGHLDATGFWAYLGSMWDVGGRRPQMSMHEVVAVRDDRLAAVREVIDYGNDADVEGIVCFCLDPDLKRMQRAVIHDPSDADAAIRELDRMHAEIAHDPGGPRSSARPAQRE